MTHDSLPVLKRVLVASANPLFSKGLEKLLLDQVAGRPLEIRLTRDMAQTIQALESWQPELVVVDYDDQTINRGEFLNHFVSSDRPMQVLLVSLQTSGAVVVYDRRTLTTSQAIDWLNLPWASQTAGLAENEKPERPISREISQPSQPVVNRILGKKKDENNMRHFAVAGILVIVSTVIVYAILQVIGLLPVAASAQAISIDRLFNLHFFLISFFFSLILVFLFYSLVVFRRKAGSAESGKHITGSTPLEVTWTIIPLGIVLTLSYLGSISLAEIRRADPQPLEVKVIAGQWYWKYEYPEYEISSSTLYLPVNRQVLLRLTSMDVIHSFWVPEFRVKQDVLPGANLVKELRITPTRIGQYTVLCAELCGGAHAQMTSPVVVMSQQEFEQWLSTESAAMNDPIKRGEKYAKENGCIGCHSLDGTRLVGPSFKGLFGSQRELMDGSTVAADAGYLKKAIQEPNAQVVKGYPAGVMPQTYRQTLTEQQIEDIITFIETLK